MRTHEFMGDGHTTVHAYNAGWDMSIRLIIFRWKDNKPHRLDVDRTDLKAEWVPHENNGEIVPPSIILDRHSAQELMDRLYSFGVRPSDERANDPALKASNSHLEDMRSIAFGVLDKMGIKGADIGK